MTNDCGNLAFGIVQRRHAADGPFNPTKLHRCDVSLFTVSADVRRPLAMGGAVGHGGRMTGRQGDRRPESQLPSGRPRCGATDAKMRHARSLPASPRDQRCDFGRPDARR